MNRKFLRRNSNSSMVETRTLSGTVADILIVLVLIGVMIICFVPLWYVLVASVSDGKAMFATEGLILKPVGDWTLDGYKLILKDNSILVGYRNTLLYVVSTTLLGLLIMEAHGINFTQEHMAQIWQRYLPIGPEEPEGMRGCWWGERIMMKNLEAGMPLPEAGIRRNPNMHWLRREAGDGNKEILAKALQILTEFDK